jgi:hypothetical protein
VANPARRYAGSEPARRYAGSDEYIADAQMIVVPAR